jgi:hypothetical protein
MKRGCKVAHTALGTGQHTWETAAVLLVTRTGKQASGQHDHFPLVISETEFSE